MRRTVRRLAALLAAAAFAAAAPAGCGSADSTADCTTTKLLVECAADQRSAAPQVTGELLDGGSYDVAQDRGKVVVVNFWGSWCSPCRAEAEDLQKTYDATKDKGVAFLGVDWRDDRDSAKAFQRGRVTYPSLYDFDSKVALNFEVTPTGTPSTLILDRQGRVAIAIRRATTYSELLPLVQKVAAEANG